MAPCALRRCRRRISWSGIPPVVRTPASAMDPTEVAGPCAGGSRRRGLLCAGQARVPRVYEHFDSLDAADVANRPHGERAEEDNWENTLAEARASDALFTGPVIVLSSPRADLAELGPIWTDEQRRRALRGPRREYVRVDSVGHAIHRDRPAVVLDAVRRIIALSGAAPR